MAGRTVIEIVDDDFLINGRMTYTGRYWRGWRIEGLLANSRMVQATFDDLNPETRSTWSYPDTGIWDPERHVSEFIAMLPEYHRRGLLAVTLNLQGGCPNGYCREQPWNNSAFTADGALLPAYLDRLSRVLERLDELGMAAILGLFYFGQDERLADEAAARRGVENVLAWLWDGGWRNVILEIANECDVPRYEHAVLQPDRIAELIERVHQDGRFLVGTSYRGGAIPDERVLAISDLTLLHGNGVREPEEIGRMVEYTRAVAGRPLPVVFNEDDHFDFDQLRYHLLVATEHHASWGYFDPGPGAGGLAARSDYREGFQNVPVNWRINTPRKRAFFERIAEMTGSR